MFSLINLIFLTYENYFSISNLAKTITVAFNEPPESDEVCTNHEFANRPTRVPKITRETRTINAYMNCGADLNAIPEYCITVGMKEIFKAKRIIMIMPRDWNAGVHLEGPYFSGAGTSYMVYPSDDGDAYQSVRLKTFSEGLIDMRALVLLEKLAGRDICNKIIHKHFGEPRFNCSPDNPQDYADFINELYQCIKNY